MRRLAVSLLLGGFALIFSPLRAHALEPVSDSVRAALTQAVSADDDPDLGYDSDIARQAWVTRLSPQISRRVPDDFVRTRLLRTLHYEAVRAGVDPLLVLGLVTVESGFDKYAVSRASARGYMQVMPFWTHLLGHPGDDLFDTRTNLRYGCTILRHYIDIEHGNLYRALGRYNGSLGQPAYPGMVLAAWQRYQRAYAAGASTQQTRWASQ